MALVPFPSATPVPRDPDDDELQDDDGAGGKMSFLEHLDELRKRLIGCGLRPRRRAASSRSSSSPRSRKLILQPLQQLMPSGTKLMYTAPTEGFMTMMKIGALAGLFVALPFIILQLWLFIAPGLYSNEKRFAVPFVMFGTFFFVVGRCLLALHRVPVHLEVLPGLRKRRIWSSARSCGTSSRSG